MMGGLASVACTDTQHAWAVGSWPSLSPQSIIMHTSNGGQDWDIQTNETANGLNAVAFADSQQGWAVGRAGEGGIILHTANGGQDWAIQYASTNHSQVAELASVAFADGQHGWAVGVGGKGGVILHTTNGGKDWAVLHTDTELHSVAFVDTERGWAVGDAGTILHTADGGRTWVDQRGYRRWPAPLYYVSLILAGLVFWWRVWPDDDTDHTDLPSIRTIVDKAVSDRPLTAKEFDALQFGSLAEGIANYLRNDKTTGPLTIAISGEWGSGKSSLMGVLRDKLERKGFRPVWFNAWHHQQEEQLLAALLKSVRTQAVPSCLSLHPLRAVEGIGFRARLIWRRVRRRWPLVLVGVGCCAALVAVIVDLGPDRKTWQESLASPSWVLIATKLAVLGGAVVSLYSAWKGVKPFGLDPARLLASASATARVSDLGAQTSFRHRFARQFADVTAALQPRTMTVFIDDLDRCEPAQVMQLMQSLNFLASSGECFLIVGMDEQEVTNSVAVSMKGQFDMRDGRALLTPEKESENWKYAQKWMEKLIQIRVPVPHPDEAQFKALLAGADSPLLAPDDLIDLPSLASRLKLGKRPVDAWLATQLSAGTKSALAGYAGLVKDFNEVIGGSAIYEGKRFTEVSLGPETKELTKKELDKDELQHLNRLLLEDAYPGELRRRPGTRAAETGWTLWGRWIANRWERAKPLGLAAAAGGVIFAGYQIADYVVETGKQPREVPQWSTNSVIPAPALTRIVLESPERLPGTELMTTHTNLTNWMAGKKWGVKLEFEPPPAPSVPDDKAPRILLPPQSQSVALGSDVTFTVAAGGAEPLAYQWRFDETNLTSQTNRFMALTNVQSANLGNYAVVVTNAFGATNSPPALLTLALEPGTKDTEQIRVPRGDGTVVPGQTDWTWSWWLLGVSLAVLLGVGIKQVFDHLNQQVRDTDEFRDALDRWSDRIWAEGYRTPRAAKRLVNKLRFFAMVMRALKVASAGTDIPDGVVVAFGVLEERRIRDGKLQSGLELPEKLKNDETALRESLAKHPGVFRYLQSTLAEAPKA